VPHALVDIVRSWADADLCRIAPNGNIPLLLLKEPDSPGEEGCSHEVQNAGGSDEEKLEM